jgi:hypothetical protein
MNKMASEGARAFCPEATRRALSLGLEYLAREAGEDAEATAILTEALSRLRGLTWRGGPSSSASDIPTAAPGRDGPP